MTHQVEYSDMERVVQRSLGVSLAMSSRVGSTCRLFKELRALLNSKFCVFVDTNHPDFAAKGEPGAGAGRVFRFPTLAEAVQFYNECDAHLIADTTEVRSWSGAQVVRGR